MEGDPLVSACARKNFAALGLDQQSSIRCGDWLEYFADPPIDVDGAVFVVAPPWGDAFTFQHGLDLSRTVPPVDEVLDAIVTLDRSGARFAVVQVPVYEPVQPVSLRALRDRFPLLDHGPGYLLFDLSR